MPSSSKPRKAKPNRNGQKRITWDELRDPVDKCQAALSAMALQIAASCAPGTLLLTPSDSAEFQALKTSCNKDLTELQVHLDDVASHIKPRYGSLVTENDLIEQLNFGNTLMTLLQRAQLVLGPDVSRLAGLRTQGIANYQARQAQQEAAAE